MTTPMRKRSLLLFTCPVMADIRPRIRAAHSWKAAVVRLTKQYELAVVRDPSFATKIEVVLRISSYLIPGKLSSWKHLSELAYTVSNLFTLFNDYLIINKCPTASPVTKLTFAHRHLLWAISVLEYTEVLAEVSSEHLWREAGKWFTILLMRLMKLVLQCIAVFKYKSHLLSSPAVPCVDRKKVKYVSPDIVQPPEGKGAAYVGKRTGKVIRSLYADPALPYSELINCLSGEDYSETAGIGGAGLSRAVEQPRVWELVAESLHIARPIVHLVAMVKYKENSWKPWLISLLMDVLSLHFHGGLLKFNRNNESSEILRRRLVLMLYLLRSPVYERFSKDIVFSVLRSLASHAPLVHFIVDPLLEYIPVWQQVYSYNWLS